VPIGEEAVAQGGIAAVASAGTGPAAQYATELKADLLGEGDKVKLDGLLSEWPARTRATLVQGSPEPAVAFATALQYDATTLYVAGEVTSATFTRTSRFADDEDHAALVLSFTSGPASAATYEIDFFAGKPGETAGQVRFGAGSSGAVPGARIVEAPTATGYAFEAAVPWAALPEARTIRVGLHGVARYFQRSGRASRILATGPGDARHRAELPPLPLEAEQALTDGLRTQRALVTQAPSFDLIADVVGDAFKEHIQVWGSLLTVCGPGYRGGKEYFFRDVGAPIVRLEARALTGRGKDDLVMVRRVSTDGATREWFEGLSFLGGDEPVRTFGQEISVARGDKHVTNAMHAAPEGLEVSILPAVGWDASSYKELLTTEVLPVLLPWEGVRSQSFRFNGTRFAKTAEATKPSTPVHTVGPRIVSDPSMREPVAPAPVAAPEIAPNALLDQYKRDHGVPLREVPRFDLRADLDGDGQPERIVLFGRDLVVSGPAFHGGHEYVSLTLQQFTAPEDIHEITPRDVAGGGSADLVIRGTRHVSPSAGGAPVHIDMIFLYALQGGALTRVFGVETAREQAGKRAQGMVQFIPARSGRGFDVDVRPGRVTGWTQSSYPWPQERPGAGSTEPLLLPWGGIPSLRYAWDGAHFSP
jgi:hypothetical protein